MPNPVIAEVTRGGVVESRHTGAYAVVDAAGKLVASAGDVTQAVFPRSAIKAFQCLPLIESGAADRFGFSDEELALACASHSGEAPHVRVAGGMLAKAGMSEAQYECGAHWPYELSAQHDMVRHAEEPRAIHNNCSGKHAGMLALAHQLGVPAEGYSRIDHPVQRAIARTLSELCDVDIGSQPHGIDGCSVPTWAIPLRNLALGFARFASGATLDEARKAASLRIIEAVRAHPFMVAGTNRFCTRVMQRVPRAFVKTGAEGVFCGAVPHAGFGIALKCDDGASRASESAMAAVLASLPVWTDSERQALKTFAGSDLSNWRKIHVGDVHALI
ncbi:asparaginase [Taklimakanibacter deserti]|uniref:asparaginase n=1 Tax=Taklimakanibacter deserti TaxID=2267839 RepID=UPI000E654A43